METIFQPYKETLRKIRHVVMDMDGTIYHGKNLFPTTIPFLNRLRELGIGYTFLTNNSSRSTDVYLQHLQDFGITVPREAITVWFFFSTGGGTSSPAASFNAEI